MSRRVIIFGWHNVEGTWTFPSAPGLGLAGMRRQFELLARVANVIELKDAVRGLKGEAKLPPRAAVITFDDGYQDNLDLAAPLLAELGLPATFFLCPEILSGNSEPWWERLGRAFTLSEHSRVEWQDEDLSLEGGAARAATFGCLSADLKKMEETDRQKWVDTLVARLGGQPDGPAVAMMDWDGARRLSGMGFTIGSHSSRHVILANETPQSQRDDLRSARERLSAGLGVDVDLLAYPNGTAADYSEATVTAAGAAGYRAAVTTIPGWNSPATSQWELRRFVMYPEWGRKGFGIVPRHPVRRARTRLQRAAR